MPALVDHEHARELDAISRILDAHPQVVDVVFHDLPRGQVMPKTGRPAMTAEQVLRAAIVKQMHGLSYEDLAFHLADSLSFRSFCRLDLTQAPPAKSTLQANIKHVTAETWEEINQLLVMHAKVEGIEDGKKVRFDCTVTETNIHDPSDEALLWDVVRVLTRLMAAAGDEFGIRFTDHTRRAKRRANGVRNAKNDRVRKQQYLDLLDATNDTLAHARRVAVELEAVETADVLRLLKAEGLSIELKRFVSLGERVEDQTHRRVVFGEIVPAGEKVVSIFETHTDIIIKDRRDTLYGHKVCLAVGRSSLVLDAVVLEGNPADSTLPSTMVERQERLYGRVPRQAAFDGGFSSRMNLDTLKDMGVEDVAFSKGRGISVSEMVRSSWVYRKLRDFRAGIEGCISFLKRCFGLTRCLWRGLESFGAYVWASVVAANLLVIARHQLRESG
jgi:IS5 family transposase